jgi:hypothetical protein
MSDQPQRPAEQALRDYAEQRRAQSPPTELHPATRRLLQGEVTRTYGAKAAPAARPAAVPWLATWWGRLALGAPALAAIVVVVVVLNRERKLHLALNTGPAPAATQEIEAAGKPATAPASTEFTDAAIAGAAAEHRSLKVGRDISVATTDAKSETLVGLDEMRRKQPAETPVPDRSLRGASLESLNPSGAPDGAFSSTGQVMLTATTATRGGFGVAADKDAVGTPAAPMSAAAAPAQREDKSYGLQLAERGTTKQMARAEPPPPPTAAPTAQSGIAPAAGLAFSKLGAAYSAPAGQVMNRQQFVQSDDRAALRRNFNSPAPSPVLNSFQFENTGHLVQITDADGSVYSGQIVGLADAAGPPAEAKAEEQAASQRLRVNESLAVGTANSFSGNTQLNQSAVAQNIFFRVQGTNRTLQQPVEFEGNLLLPVLGNQQVQGSTQLQPQQSPTPALLQQGQIQGRAIIGGRTQLDVRAGATP